jgi:KDO2-lipid IV(A) lauroyltransferase
MITPVLIFMFCAMKSLLATTTIRLFGLLPMPLAQFIGLLVGRLLYWLPNSAKHESQLNIQRCLPELNPNQQQNLLKASLAHTAMAMLEMGHNWCGNSKTNLSRINTVCNQHLLEDDKPRVILTPHLGNWELFAAWLASQTHLTALYKPAKLAALDQLIAKGRQASGMALAPASATGVKALKRALNNQQSILILPDQEPPGSAAVEVTFFAQPAYTMTLAAQLAKSKDIQIILGWAKREGIGKGYTIELVDITANLKGTDIKGSVQAMNNAIADLIRTAPAQYQWEYRRFKHTLEQQ